MTLLRNEAHPDFMTLLADRIHAHFFNDGVLTAAQASERYTRYMDEARTPYLAEYARWPAQTNRTMRAPSAWESYHQYFLDDEFHALPPQRIALLKAAGMYPDIDTPSFGPHGGSLGQSGQLALSVPTSVSTVYHSFAPAGTDPAAVDPRLSGGVINPAASLLDLSNASGAQTYVQTGAVWKYLDDASDQGPAWRSPNFDDSSWESGPSELGYGESDQGSTVGFVDLEPDTPGFQRNATTYFRKSDIVIPDPAIFENFTLNYVFDDGIAIYVNGVEVERNNLNENAAFDDYATQSSIDNENVSITVDRNFFVAGNNTIAVEIHQVSATNSDISFDLELIGNPPGGGGNLAVTFTLNEPVWLLSRSYNPDTQQWSALNSAFFTLSAVPADASNLVVSKVHYHPADASTAAELAVTTDQDDFEFIELLNVGTSPVSLAGVTLTGGINFLFGENNEIPVGGRMIIPKNRQAFEARYSDTFLFATDILGGNDFEMRLSNNSDQLILTEASGTTMHNFTYSDSSPWPSLADGAGFSLVLKNPTQLPDHSIPQNWAASVESDGAPGAENNFGFTGDPLADNDRDGYNALLEYALGSSDSSPDRDAITLDFANFTIDGSTAEYLTLSFRRNLHSENVLTIQPQVSTDLVNWNGPPSVIQFSEIEQEDGTSIVTYRSATPRSTNPSLREFLRIHVSSF